MAVPVQVNLNPNARKVEEALARIKAQAKGINLGGGAESINKLSRPLGKITGQASEFQKSLEASNARVLAFGASVAVINKLSQAFGALVTNTIKVEASFAKINTILGGTQKQLEQFGNGIFKVAQQTGTSFDQVAEGALELARQGLSVEESLSRVSTALKLVRVSGIDAEKAVGGLTAAIKGFEGAGLTVAQIADKLAQVDTKFAVSTEDLINGLERASASARVAGVSFDELLGVVTTVQERTQRGGAVIGNAFKTIFARLGRTDTLVALQDLGISVLDAQGNVRGAIPLFEELAVELNKIGLKSVEAGEIIQKVAGVRQRDILISLIEDLNSGQSQFAKSLQVSAGAAGALDAKNSQLNQTLEALINNLTVGSQKLASVLGDLGFTDAAGDILKALSSIVNGITDILQGEGIGAKFAQGLVKGVGSVLTGPGLALISAIFIKLFVDLAKFGATSLKQILGINKAAAQQATLQQSVLQTLLQNEIIQREILALEGNKVAQEQLLLKIYNQQAAALARVQKAAATVTPGLFGAGLRGGEGGVKPRGKASGGYIAAEARDVSRGVGGAPANSRVVSIPNFAFGGGQRGTIVANTSEYIVPNFAGGGDAIFNRDMVRSMGLPAGARKINAAGGFVPNFVKPSTPLSKRKDITTREQAEKAGYSGAAISSRFGKAPEKSRRTTYDVDLNDVLGKEMPAMFVPSSGGGVGKITRAKIPGFKDARAIGEFMAYGPNYGSMKNLEQEIENKFGQKNIEDFAAKEALGLARNIASAFALDPVDPQKISQVDGVKGFISSAVGAFGGIFDAALTTALKLNATDESSGGDFDVDLTKSDIGNIQKVFGKRAYPRFVDNKINANQGASMFEKTKRTPTLMKKINDRAFEEGKKQGFIKASSGYIPNFAGGALEEAIGREQAAGLPINQIRINQSGKLRNAQNPMGLAVTNTRDEPTGAIPNFARSAGGATNSNGTLDGAITKIFALQLATSGLTSAFTEQDSIMRRFGEAASTAINTMLVLSTVGVNPFGKTAIPKGVTRSVGKTIASFGKLARFIGPVAKGLFAVSRFIGPISIGFFALNSAIKAFTGKGIFQRVGEGLGLVATEAQKAAKRIEEGTKNLGKGTEGKDVLENLQTRRANILTEIERQETALAAGTTVEKLDPNAVRGQTVFDALGVVGGRLDQTPEQLLERYFGGGKIEAGYGKVDKRSSEIIRNLVGNSVFSSVEEVQRAYEQKGSPITQESAKKIFSEQKKSFISFDRALASAKAEGASDDVIQAIIKEFQIALASSLAEAVKVVDAEKLVQEGIKKNTIFSQTRARGQIQGIGLRQSESIRARLLEDTKENRKKLATGGFGTELEKVNAEISIKERTNQAEIETKRVELNQKIREQLIEQSKISGEISGITKEDFDNKVETFNIEKLAGKDRKQLLEEAAKLGFKSQESQENFVQIVQNGTTELANRKQELSDELDIEKSIAQTNAERADKEKSINEALKKSLRTMQKQAQLESIRKNAEKERLGLILNDPTAAFSDKYLREIKYNQELAEIEEARVQSAKKLEDLNTELNALIELQKNASEENKTAAQQLVDEKQYEVDLAKENNTELEKTLDLREKIAKKIKNGTALDQANAQRQRDLKNLEENVPKRLADNLENSISSAMDNLATGTYDSLSDVFLNIALDFGRTLQQEINAAVAKSLVQSFTSSSGGGGFMSGIGNLFASAFGKNTGGLITGGSGVRDDVPAVLTGGEYVIKKSAVQKYGVGFLENLNSGAIRGMQGGGLYTQTAGGYSGGRFWSDPSGNQMGGAASNERLAIARGMDFFVPGTRGAGAISGKESLLAFAQQETTSGKTDVARSTGSGAFVSLEDQSFRLSTFGRFRDSPARRALKDAQRQAFDLYTQRVEEEKRVIEEKKQAEKARDQQFKQAVVGSFVNAAIAGAGAYFQNGGTLFGGSDVPKINLTEGQQAIVDYQKSIGAFKNPFDPSTGGPMKFQLPDSFYPEFGGLGNATVNMGKANGGSMNGVTNALLMGGEYVMSAPVAAQIGRENLDSINMMNFNNGGAVGNVASSSGAKSSGGGADIGEVNITINMEKGDASVTTSSDGNADSTKTNDFARKVKEVVVNVIAEEKRLSGSLFGVRR